MKVYESSSPLFQDHGFFGNLKLRFKLWRAWRKIERVEVDENLKKRIGKFSDIKKNK